MKVLTARLLVLAIYLYQVSAQDTNCDYNQNVQFGQTYYVYSRNYPGNYPPGITCRWILTCPSGYNCRIDCPVIRIPASQNCLGDRLLISRSGDAGLAGADVYCGTGSTSITSTQRAISIGLISTSNSAGGSFMCTVVAVLATSTNSCSCGWKKTNRIVGGVPTGINEYPPMVGMVDLRIREIKCGATIISQQYVVSAAHCTTGHTTSTLGLLVGEHDITIGDSPATQAYAIANILRHPSYNSNTYANDISLLRTVLLIAFSDRVGPACLPFKYASASFAGTKATVLGWGTLTPGGPKPNALQKVQLDVISTASCQAMISTTTSDMICFKTPGKDACQDDSGGPCFFEEPSTGLLFLIGISSYGNAFCASPDYPGVGTRVTSYLDWIVANVGNNFCRK